MQDRDQKRSLGVHPSLIKHNGHKGHVDRKLNVPLRPWCPSCLTLREYAFDLGVRPWDDVDRDELAHAARSRGACVGRGLHVPDIAAHPDRHVPPADLPPPDYPHLASLAPLVAPST